MDYLHTSKGNQTKFEKDGYWYKEDFMGYEALAEEVSSKILNHSNIRELGFDFVKYEAIEIDGRVYSKSPNFLEKGESVVQLIRMIPYIIRTKTWEINMSTEERIEVVVNEVKKITGITNFGDYLSFMLSFDQAVLNEDRHFGNICVLKGENGYRLCPIFDNGLSLLSDIKDYYINSPLQVNMRKVKARPFNTKFSLQTDILNALYPNNQFKIYSKPEIMNTDLYPEDYYNRVRDIIAKI